MAEPQKGVAYDFFTTLDDEGTGEFIVNPTIATGDFRIKKDIGAFNNLEQLPFVDPPGSVNVRVKLSAVEMNADKIIVVGIDIAGNEWRDFSAFIDTPNPPNTSSQINLAGFTLARDNTKGLRRSAGNRRALR